MWVYKKRCVYINKQNWASFWLFWFSGVSWWILSRISHFQVLFLRSPAVWALFLQPGILSKGKGGEDMARPGACLDFREFCFYGQWRQKSFHRELRNNLPFCKPPFSPTIYILLQEEEALSQQNGQKPQKTWRNSTSLILPLKFWEPPNPKGLHPPVFLISGGWILSLFFLSDQPRGDENSHSLGMSKVGKGLEHPGIVGDVPW